MPGASQGTPEEYANQLSEIANPVAEVDPELDVLIRHMVAELEHLDEVTHDSLAGLIAGEPG